MKVNKLAKVLCGESIYNDMLNNPSFEGWDKSCTGKTTALILYYIADALDNPNKELVVREPDKPYNLSCSAGGMVDSLVRTINILGLRFMKFNRVKGTLTYELFEEVEDETVQQKSELNILKEKLIDATLRGNLDAVSVYSQAIQRIR